MPREIDFGNKKDGTCAVKETRFFVFPKTCCLGQHLCCHSNAWLKVVTSHWTAMAMRTRSQTVGSITAVLEFEKKDGRFFPQDTCISQNRDIWD